MATKKTFTDLNTDLLAAMCRNVAYGQPASVAKSDLGNMQVVKNSFVDVHNTTLELSCKANCTTPAQVILGDDLETKYKSWPCGADTCSGKLYFLK